MTVRSAVFGPPMRKAAGLAAIAAAAVSLSACAPAARHTGADTVSADVYGHVPESARGVTSDVYSPGALHRW